MKKSKILFGTVAFITLSLSSCQKEKVICKESLSASEKVGFEIVAEYAPQTKTYLDAENKVHWSENESLAVFEVANFATFDPVTSYAASSNGTNIDGDDKKMTFSVTFPSQKYANKLNYYAVYPNNAVPANIKTSKNIDVSNVTVTLNEIQKPTATSFAPDADILAGSLTIIPDNSTKEEEEGLLFSFARLVSIGKMNITNIRDNDKNPLVGEPIYRIEIKANSNISGNTVFNLKNRVAKDGKYGNKKTIILDYSYDDSNADPIIKTPEENTKTAVYFTTWPFTVATGGTFDVSIETPDYIITKTISITGKDLVFNKGNIRSFTVDFSTGTVNVTKKAGSLLDEESTYVIKKGEALMSSTVYTNGTLTPKDGYTTADKKVIIDEELLSAAWGFEYHKMSRTYKIHSLSNPDKYLVAGANSTTSLTLSTKDAATDFIISENNGIYTVSGNNAYLGYLDNAGGKRFLMIQNNNASTSLEIIEATVQPAIKVNSTTVDVPGDFSGVQSIPVSYFAIDSETVVNVELVSDENGNDLTEEYDWINEVKFSKEDKSEITFNIETGNTQTERTAYIKIYAEKEGKVIADKILKVVQHTTYYYASLDIAEKNLIQAKKDGLWGGYGKVYTYEQANGATWEIDANTDGTVSFYAVNTLKNGSIKLPDFSNNITTVIIKLKEQIAANKELQLYNGSTLLTSKTTNNTDLVYRLIVPATFEEGTVKTGVIKSTGYAKIVCIDVDTRKVLGTPTGLSVAEGTKRLSWNNVQNAESYDVTVGDKTVNVPANGETRASYTFDTELPDEYYDVTIVAKVDGQSKEFIDSEPAKSIGKLKFGDPALQKPDITVEGMTATTLKVKWAAVEKASTYECKLNNEITADVVDYKNGYYGAQFSNLDAKLSPYTVTVTAKHADENVYKSSSESKEVTLPDVTLDHDGSEKDPYSVKDVNSLKKNGLLNLTGKYVEGTVVGAPSYPSPSLNEKTGIMTYTITDGTDSLAVKGYDLGKVGFSSEDDLPLNSEVVIYYTDNTNNYLYSINNEKSVVTDITVTPTKTLFYTGDKLVKPVVTGIFRGAPDNFDVTESCSFEGYDSNTVGPQTITVIYNPNPAIRNTYNITVNALDNKEYIQIFNSTTADLQTNSKEYKNTYDQFTVTLTNIRNGNTNGYFANWVRCIKTGADAITGKITTDTINTEIRTVVVTLRANTAGSVANKLVIRNGTQDVCTIEGTTILGVEKPIKYSIPANIAGKGYTYELQFVNNGTGKNPYIDISKIVYSPNAE